MKNQINNIVANIKAEGWPFTVKNSEVADATLIEQTVELHSDQVEREFYAGVWTRYVLIVGDVISVDVSDWPEDGYSDEEWDLAWEVISSYFPPQPIIVEPQHVESCDLADEDIPF